MHIYNIAMFLEHVHMMSNTWMEFNKLTVFVEPAASLLPVKKSKVSKGDKERGAEINYNYSMLTK